MEGATLPSPTLVHELSRAAGTSGCRVSFKMFVKAVMKLAMQLPYICMVVFCTSIEASCPAPEHVACIWSGYVLPFPSLSRREKRNADPSSPTDWQLHKKILFEQSLFLSSISWVIRSQGNRWGSAGTMRICCRLTCALRALRLYSGSTL